MFFNSIDFALFLPSVFGLYWLLKKVGFRAQNILILVASYFFYGYVEPKFLILILGSSVVDFFVGLKLSQTEKAKERKWLLALSIAVNLGALMFFKYFNFFIDNFEYVFNEVIGFKLDPITLNIILPVGISFYTFQTLSYSIDVYKRKLEPTKDFIAFLTFVSFFPQLVAGPIERAKDLLPQFLKEREFDLNKAKDGMRQVLFGLFKKIVIADNCAVMVNQIFDNYQDYNGITLFVGAALFAFQIYSDFSGYSDIAIGTARLFGFNLKRNFAFPYFAWNMAEFWKRWHISLTSWFRDYVYIPIGGSRGSFAMIVRNTFIIFIVSGFWHGANWTFIAWGALNALYFVPVLFRRSRAKRTGRTVIEFDKGIYGFISACITFVLTCFAWIFFRANNISHAFSYIKQMVLNPYESIGQPLIFLVSTTVFVRVVTCDYRMVSEKETTWT